MSACTFCQAAKPSPEAACPACGKGGGAEAVPDLDLPGGAPPAPRKSSAAMPAAAPAKASAGPAQAAAPATSTAMRELDASMDEGGPALELDDPRASSPNLAEAAAAASAPGSSPAIPAAPGSSPAIPAAHGSSPAIPAAHGSSPAIPAAHGSSPALPPAPPAPPTPAEVIARYPAAPPSVWGAPHYALRVLMRQMELRQDLTALRRRRSPDVPLYEAALGAHDHRAFALGLGMTLAGLFVLCLFVALPVIARFAMAPG